MLKRRQCATHGLQKPWDITFPSRGTCGSEAPVGPGGLCYTSKEEFVFSWCQSEVTNLSFAYQNLSVSEGQAAAGWPGEVQMEFQGCSDCLLPYCSFISSDGRFPIPQASPFKSPHLSDFSAPPSVGLQTLRSLYLYVGDSFLPYHFSLDIWNWILQRYHLPLTDKKGSFLAKWIFCLAPLLAPFICPLLHCSFCSLHSFLSCFFPQAPLPPCLVSVSLLSPPFFTHPLGLLLQALLLLSPTIFYWWLPEPGAPAAAAQTAEKDTQLPPRHFWSLIWSAVHLCPTNIGFIGLFIWVFICVCLFVQPQMGAVG